MSYYLDQFSFSYWRAKTQIWLHFRLQHSVVTLCSGKETKVNMCAPIKLQSFLFQIQCIVLLLGGLKQTHTHTHTFNSPLSGTTRVSQYQKGKTNMDFTEARDSEWQWFQLGHMQVCTSLQTDTTPAPHRSVFYRPDALPAAQPTASKHEEAWQCGRNENSEVKPPQLQKPLNESMNHTKFDTPVSPQIL